MTYGRFLNLWKQMPGVIDYFTPKNALQAQLDAKEEAIRAWNEAQEEGDPWRI